MRLWQKIFLTTFVLFVVAFDLGIFALSNLSYRAATDTARSQSLTEYGFINTSLSADIDALTSRGQNSPDALASLMAYYCGSYGGRGVALELRQGAQPMGGNLPDDIQPDVSATTPPTSVIISTDNQYWVVTSGLLPTQQTGYALTYAVDITSLHNQQMHLRNQLFLIGAAITAGFSLILLLIMRRLTRPIRVLQETADKVGQGDYSARTNIVRHDDIGALAQRFDAMTQQVAAHVEQARDQARRQQQFTDNMAHELRTPLTSIFGNAELLRQARLSEDEALAATGRIMSSACRIQLLSQKLLDLALARASSVQPKPIILRHLFGEVTDAVAPLAQAAQVQVITDCNDQTVLGDPILLETMLINLLDNAIKASPSRTVVHLDAITNADGVTISVRDQGHGISPQHLSHVFDAFYRTDEARSAKQGGTGLGLALCKQIADAHGAALHIDSSPGQGTTVTLVQLPLADDCEDSQDNNITTKTSQHCDPNLKSLANKTQIGNSRNDT